MPFSFTNTIPFFLFFSLLTTTTTTVSTALSYGITYHIDCGSPTNSTDAFNTTWLSDRFFTGGTNAIVSEPLRFHHQHEKTLRFFPISSGKKNCYAVPSLPSSARYLIRTFVVYDNYDGKSHPPSFDVSVSGTVVFSWRSPWPETLSRDGAYSDLFVFLQDEALICFYSFATDPPVVSSLELFAVDPVSYDSVSLGNNKTILVNYGRLSCGSNQWGPGFTNDVDLFKTSLFGLWVELRVYLQ